MQTVDNDIFHQHRVQPSTVRDVSSLIRKKPKKAVQHTAHNIMVSNSLRPQCCELTKNNESD